MPRTKRQREIIRLIMQGYTTREMAKALHIGIGTLKAHLNRLYLMFDIDSRYVKRVRLIHLLYAQSRRQRKRKKG